MQLRCCTAERHKHLLLNKKLQSTNLGSNCTIFAYQFVLAWAWKSMPTERRNCCDATPVFDASGRPSEKEAFGSVSTHTDMFIAARTWHSEDKMERTTWMSGQPAALDKLRPIAITLCRSLCLAGCLFMLGGAGMAKGSCMKPQEPVTPPVAARTNTLESGSPLVTEAVRRSRPFTLPGALKSLSALKVGEMIDLRLFPDTAYRARIRSVSENVAGTTTLIADIDGVDAANMIAVVTGGKWLITITIPPKGTTYIIRYDASYASYRVDELWLEEQPIEPNSQSTPR